MTSLPHCGLPPIKAKSPDTDLPVLALLPKSDYAERKLIERSAVPWTRVWRNGRIESTHGLDAAGFGSLAASREKRNSLPRQSVCRDRIQCKINVLNSSEPEVRTDDGRPGETPWPDVDSLDCGT